ncbi:MAG: DUF937 domain-containing protein [Saprospiraceae bacterium]|jgi:OOP family OmpA-OmpF porin|nr:DUF937 domain-containing protein [Saprospiraceae bacterium]
MSFNLLDLAKNYLANGDVVKAASGFLGESESGTSSALSAIIPTILGTVTQKASTTDGASGIMDLLRLGNHDGGILDNVSGLLTGGDQTNSLLSTGGSVVKSLLGDKVGGVIDLISNFAGVKQSSSSSLLSMAAPILLGLIGKKVKSDGLGVSGLMSLLGGQAANIQSAMPSGIASGLTSLLGLGSLGNIVDSVKSNVTSSTTSASTTARKVVEEENNNGGGFNWWWLLLPLALAGLFFAMRGCNEKEAVVDAVNKTKEAVSDASKTVVAGADSLASKAADATNAAVNAVKGSVNAAGDWVTDLGKMIKLSLPGGAALEVGENSVENRLVTFINDKTKAVDKTTWFSLDRLYFETGKSSLKAESQAQVKNIAAIMKAYPEVELRLGGYTDNTGKAESNLKLSAARANTAMAELVKLGVAAKRLTAEGYGQEHPICPANDTPECRAQNRRIDVRVTKK